MTWCHGNAGNLWIRKSVSDEELKMEWRNLAELVLKEKIPKKELYNPGFMTRLSGIGYAFLAEMQKGLSNILICELIIGGQKTTDFGRCAKN